MRRSFSSLAIMECEDFYVTVCSNNNNELFENTNSRFHNRLYKPIYFSNKTKYECALVNLTFEVNDNPIDLKTAPIELKSNEKIVAHKPTPQSYSINLASW